MGGRRRLRIAQHRRKLNARGETLQEGGGSGGCGVARSIANASARRGLRNGVGKEAIGGRRKRRIAAAGSRRI